MERFTHGLVAGRFAPFHAGHTRLIRYASERSDRLTVQVLSRADEDIPVSVRAGWVRRLHPEVHVVVNDHPVIEDITDPAWRSAYAEVFRSLLDRPVDAVFTLEDYGAAFAHRLGARWVHPDHGQRLIPVSGTQIRAAPERYWSLLQPPVRAWYVRQVVVLAADESRSTRLSQALADRLGCALVTCAVGEWVHARPRAANAVPDAEEIEEIGARQREKVRVGSENTPNRWLVSQADPMWMDGWLRSRSGRPDQPDQFDRPADPASHQGSPSTPVHLYVLEPERPGGSRLPGLLRDELRSRQVPWVEVSGTLRQRVDQVLAHLPETGVHPLLAAT